MCKLYLSLHSDHSFIMPWTRRYTDQRNVVCGTMYSTCILLTICLPGWIMSNIQAKPAHVLFPPPDAPFVFRPANLSDEAEDIVNFGYGKLVELFIPADSRCCPSQVVIGFAGDWP